MYYLYHTSNVLARKFVGQTRYLIKNFDWFSRY